MRGLALLRRLVLVAFFVEVGLLLVILPWSAFWERNYFVEALPVVAPVLKSPYVRGAVSGLGFLNLLAALSVMGWGESDTA